MTPWGAVTELSSNQIQSGLLLRYPISLLFCKHTHICTCGHIYTYIHTYIQVRCKGPKGPMIMGDGGGGRGEGMGLMDRWPCSAQFSWALPSKVLGAPCSSGIFPQDLISPLFHFDICQQCLNPIIIPVRDKKKGKVGAKYAEVKRGIA